MRLILAQSARPASARSSLRFARAGACLLAALALAALVPADAAAAPRRERSALDDLTPRVPGGRVSVLPVLFIPRGARAGEPAAVAAALAPHLELARAHYRALLGTTFAVAPGALAVLPGEGDDAHYQGDARAERILRELLTWRRTDRYRADVIFLVLYASSDRPIAGGGTPINGAPGSGGGYIELDLASLTTDRPYPFQSTLVHELGHAFGLAHAECYGYDQMTSGSIMSYNPAHWSSGLEVSSTPGGLGPEERAVLAMNQRVFPGLRFRPERDGAIADLARLQRCFLSPMSAAASPLVDQIGVGFELFYDGERVNGPDAALYTRQQANESCSTSRSWYPAVQIECRYNGAALENRRR